MDSDLQTPGTYLGCGVTTCGSLTAAGAHGAKELNVPHAPFVMTRGSNIHVKFRCDRTGICEEDLGNGGIPEGTKNEEVHDGARAIMFGKEQLLTPLALLSARDSRSRAELLKRKEYHQLGGAGLDDFNSEGHGSPLLSMGGENGDDATREYSRRGLVESEQACSVEPPRCLHDNKLRPSPVLVDASACLLLAKTRPIGDRPSAAKVSPPTNTPSGGAAACRSGCFERDPKWAAMTQEFVTFARQPAHWALTATISGGASVECGRGEVCKIGAANGSVVGRYACRGYLLDPIFTEHNPVIRYPRLPCIGNAKANVCKGDTLAEVVQSYTSKELTGEGLCKSGVEPYRHVTKVMHHHVSISGARKAGKQRFFDTQGRPLSPVKFHHVYDCLDKRRE